MNTPMLRLTICAIFSCALLLPGATMAQQASQAEHPVPNTPYKPAPAADLQYAIKARQHGIPLGGSASVNWQRSGRQYVINTEIRAALFGKILESRSEGGIDEYGLAPLQFTEKRFRKEPSTTLFKRDGQTIVFSQSAASYPIKGGEQDRSSAIWQLVSIARGAPEKFLPGAAWSMFVAGRRDAEVWQFKVVKQESIHTALGELASIHLTKTPPPDSQDQQLDIWLAPSLEWYPVRLRFSDADGDFVDQTLERVSSKK